MCLHVGLSLKVRSISDTSKISKRRAEDDDERNTFNLVVSAFLSVAYINNTKKRLVDTETLGKGSKFGRVLQKADRGELLRELIKAEIDLHHNRPVARVAVQRGDVLAHGILQPGGGLGSAVARCGLEE